MAVLIKRSWIQKITTIGVFTLISIPPASCGTDYGYEEVRIEASIISNVTNFGNCSPPAVHQNIQFAPAFPIIEVSEDLILAAINHTSLQNTQIEATSALTALPQKVTLLSDRDTTPTMFRSLSMRDAEPCSAGQPCPDER